MTEYAHLTELDEFVTGYLECALWATLDETTEGASLDDRVTEWDPESLTAIIDECADFVEANYEDLQEAADERGRPWDYLGHDFFLTRNRHGAGFWGYRGLGALGDRLTKASHLYGETNYWAGIDNLGRC